LFFSFKITFTFTFPKVDTVAIAVTPVVAAGVSVVASASLIDVAIFNVAVAADFSFINSITLVI